MKKGLSLGNMIYNIFTSIIYLISVPTIFVSAFSDGNAKDTADGILFIALVGLVLAIINLVVDRKNSFPIKSSVIAIVGHSIYLGFGAIMFLPALVLTIIASVFYGIDVKNKSIK